MNGNAETAEPHAWYVYAVLPEAAALPVCEQTILPGATLRLVGQGPGAGTGLACLASLVPSMPFTGQDGTAAVNDPDWVAARARTHHAVVEASGACVPLGFGTLFSSLVALRAWLAANAAPLAHALDQVGGRREWLVQLIEDADAHAAWLSRNDPVLLALAEEARAATPGKGFLLARRLSLAVQASRARRAADTAAEIAAALGGQPWPFRAEASSAGASWAILTPERTDPGMGFDALAARLAGSGLTLRLAGPFPPYGFARAAWNEVPCAA